MPVLSLNGVRISEPTSSYESAEFEFTLDAPLTQSTRIYYYTNDGTASDRYSDYNARSTYITLDAGETGGTIPITVYSDNAVEGDETFELVVLASPGITLEGGAAALVATGEIYDTDDTVVSPPAGVGPAAQPVFGPASASGTLPTLSVHDISSIEGNSSYSYQNFLITLDQPATTPVTVRYYTQDGTARGDTDYNERTGTVTIQPGFQSEYLQIAAYGDNAIEGDEDYQVVFVDIENAVFEDNAAAVSATGTILDDDGGPAAGIAGSGEPGEMIHGPETDGDPVPILRVQSASVIEGDSSWNYVNFLVTLDRPAPAAISGSYHTIDGTASAAHSTDYNAHASTFSIAAGQTSGYIRVPVYGDQTPEANETFSLILSDLTNARFEGNAPAVEATATILDDDGGAVTGTGGIDNPAQGIAPPASEHAILPTVQIHDAAMIEGNSSYEGMRFLVTLDRPAPTAMSFLYAVMDGSATADLDFYDNNNRVTIEAGQMSTYISVNVIGDNEIEGDEDFSLVLSGIRNGYFAQGAPALEATGTIIDNDFGAISGPGGIGDVARGVEGPAPSAHTVVRLVSTSVAETDGPHTYAYVHVLLSEPAVEEVVLSYETRELTATSGVDYGAVSGNLTIPVGQNSSWVRVQIYDDEALEGDEAFELVFNSVSGAGFESGTNSNIARITIRGDDGTGTAGDAATGPEFTLLPPPLNGDDTIAGTAASETLSSRGGNDLVYAGPGNDLLLGGDGNDTLYGGPDSDTLRGGDGADLLGGSIGNDSLDGGAGADELWTAAGDDSASGGGGNDTIGGSTGHDSLAGDAGQDELWGSSGNDTLSGGAGNDTLGGFTGHDSLIGDAGHDELWGASGNDTLSGGAGNDQLGGGIQADLLFGGAGADSLYGGTGNDTLFGQDGDDLIFGSGGSDLISGGAGGDTIFGGAGADTIIFGDGDGNDRVEGFNLAAGDRLQLDDDLWTGSRSAAQVVSDFGSVQGADYVLDFGGGDRILLVGQAAIAGLESQIDIV